MTTSTAPTAKPARTDWTGVARELAPRFAARAAAHDTDDSFVADNRELRARRLFPRRSRRAGRWRRIARRDVRRAPHARARCSSTALALSMHAPGAHPPWRWRHERAPVEPLLRASPPRMTSSRAAARTGCPAPAAPSVWRAAIASPPTRSSPAPRPAADLFMTMAIFDDPPARGADGAARRDPVEGGRREDPRQLAHARHAGPPARRTSPSTACSCRRRRECPAAPGGGRPAWHVVATTALPLIYSVDVGVAEAARDIAVRQAARRLTTPRRRIWSARWRSSWPPHAWRCARWSTRPTVSAWERRSPTRS